MAIVTSALWRRLDVPGHDACRLERHEAGWTLRGMAVFRQDAGPAGLSYVVDCDAAWRTVRGEVRGFVGGRHIERRVSRQGRVWTLDGIPVPALEALEDLDLGFTPATNLQQLRRIAMAEGEAVAVPVAWLDVDEDRLTALPQTYERRGEATFWYESPSAGYAALLELAPDGFIRRYPGLWEAEP